MKHSVQLCSRSEHTADRASPLGIHCLFTVHSLTVPIDRRKIQSHTSVLKRTIDVPSARGNTQQDAAEEPTSPAQKIKAHWASEVDTHQSESKPELRVRPPQFRQYHY